MKEWYLNNTNITEEQYDSILKYADMPEDLNIMSSNPKKRNLYQIEMYTLKPTLINTIKSGIRITKNGYAYHGYSFALLSKYCNDKRLLTTDRYQQCITMSMYFALQSQLDIATGIATDFRNHRFLHSVLLGKDKSGVVIVLDYTRNLVMSQEQYYDLLDFEEIKIIPNKDINFIQNFFMADPKTFEQLNINLFEYACFPEETKEALQRTRNMSNAIIN